MSSALRTQAAVTIGLLPLTLILFQEVSLISPVANAIAIPLVSLIVVPLALAGTIWQMLFDSGLLLTLSHGCMAVCYAILKWMAALDGAVWQSHAPTMWAGALGVVAAVWLLFPRGVPGRWAAAFLMVPLVARAAQPRAGYLLVARAGCGAGLGCGGAHTESRVGIRRRSQLEPGRGFGQPHRRAVLERRGHSQARYPDHQPRGRRPAAARARSSPRAPRG